MSENKDYKLQITLAIISLIGVLGTAIIANWSTIFPLKSEPVVVAPVDGGDEEIQGDQEDTVKPIFQGVLTAEIKGKGNLATSHGFFAHNGYLIAFIPNNVRNVTVTWETNGEKMEAQGRVVKRGTSFSIPREIVLLQIVEDVILPESTLPRRISTSLQAGENIKSYIAVNESSPGQVIESGYTQEVTTVNSEGESVKITLRNLLVSTNISAPGYAGAPVIDSEGNVVAMIWGGNNEKTLSIPIEYIKIAFPEAF